MMWTKQIRSLSALAGVIALLTGLLCSVAAAADEEYTEGVNYTRISPPQPISDPDKVEVVEMFWYGCPHCYHFEPTLEEWAKHIPSQVNFVRIPAIFKNPMWELHAGTYYTEQVLGILDKTHKALFDAIHRDHRRLTTEDALADFFKDYGVTPGQFSATLHSFAVQAKVRRAKDLTTRYRIDGVPSMIVDGKYLVSNSENGSYENVLKVVDYLVAKETAERHIQGKTLASH